jgi:Uma2 family endonuclease
MKDGEADMNVQSNVRMDKAAFIVWMQATEERCELAGGRVVMMPRASLAHAVMVMNLGTLLRERLDRKRWTVVTEFGLDAGPQTLRYPDILVDRAGGGGRSYTATEPILVAEILSSSTAAIDLGDKAVEYLRIPSVFVYIVLSQDEPKAWIWARQAGQFTVPRVVAGAEAVIEVTALGIALPLADIYADVDFG